MNIIYPCGCSVELEAYLRTQNKETIHDLTPPKVGIDYSRHIINICKEHKKLARDEYIFSIENMDDY
jgi:hypothetical protein